MNFKIVKARPEKESEWDEWKHLQSIGHNEGSMLYNIWKQPVSERIDDGKNRREHEWDKIPNTKPKCRSTSVGIALKYIYFENK